MVVSNAARIEIGRANEQVMHAMQDSYRDRRARKGDFRRLWISRINAAARQNGGARLRRKAALGRDGAAPGLHRRLSDRLAAGELIWHE